MSQPTGFLGKGRVVLVLQGRYAGRKAIILQKFEKSKQRPYTHAIIAGISKPPRKVNRKMTNDQIKRKSRMRTFVKVINISHLMPTRYMFDTKKYMSGMKVPELSALRKKEGNRKRISGKIRRSFEKAYFQDTNPKHRWFFRKLNY